MQLLIATGSPFLQHTHTHFHKPPLSWEKWQTFWILMQKREKRTKNWIESLLFQFPLLASCCIPPIVFFFFAIFFPDEFYDIFLPSPLHLLLSLSPSLLSLTPQQFSPDRFHSVLEGMDLIALWGLVGCAGLGCLISVPCRDWFNASWSWNCLIVQPSGDSPCLRRPAGLAKHCSRLLLYAAGGKSMPKELKFGWKWLGGWGSQHAWQTRGHACRVDNLLSSLEFLTQEICADLTGMFILKLFHLSLMLYGNDPIDY